MKTNYYILSNETEGNICVVKFDSIVILNNDMHALEYLKAIVKHALEQHFDEEVIVNRIETFEYDRNYALISADTGEFKYSFELNKTWIY